MKITELFEDYIVHQKFIFNFLAGGTSASLAISTVAPLERVKLLLQVQDSSKIPESKKVKGIIDAFRRIPKEQGFPSLWRGNAAAILRCFPYQALNYSLKDQFKVMFTRKVPTVSEHFWLRFGSNLLSGGLAGCVAIAFIYPLDYARTRLAMDMGKIDTNKNTREFPTLRSTFSKVYKTDGIRGIYGGISSSIIGVFVYRAAFFGIFDTGRELTPEGLKHKFWPTFLMAEFSSLFSGFVSYPFDTVRRGMMMQAGLPKEERKYKNAWNCWWVILRDSGIRGFYQGAVANMLRGTTGAITLFLYDEMQYHFLNVSRSPISQINMHNMGSPVVIHRRTVTAEELIGDFDTDNFNLFVDEESEEEKNMKKLEIIAQRVTNIIEEVKTKVEAIKENIDSASIENVQEQDKDLNRKIDEKYTNEEEEPLKIKDFSLTSLKNKLVEQANSSSNIEKKILVDESSEGSNKELEEESTSRTREHPFRDCLFKHDFGICDF